MIESAEQFIQLRTSELLADYERAAREGARDEVWLDVIERFSHFAPWVAHNKTISATIIYKLFELQRDEVLFVLAMKRRTPHDLLIKLSQHPNESIRLAVAKNARAPREALDLLKEDDWVAVREAVANRIY